MADLFDANNSSRITVHTIYGRIYNRAHFGRDRIMPTKLNLAFMGVYNNSPSGYRQYLQTTPQAPNLHYGGPFAIADLPTLQRKLPWERIIK